MGTYDTDLGWGADLALILMFSLSADRNVSTALDDNIAKTMGLAARVRVQVNSIVRNRGVGYILVKSQK